MQLEYGTQVLHALHGLGTVQVVQADGLVLIEFKVSILRLPASELKVVPSWSQKLAQEVWDNPLEVLGKAQAHLIRSINQQWGVFSLSRIQLLPHQLWVCRKVSASWPARWLVADDVGLGKTIEAGLILMSGLAHKRIRRFLILCPAGLVPQWQTRLRDMFDIRTTIYDPALDLAKGHFWEDNNAVVASFHTLREDHKNRHTRLLTSPPWDLVIVDEAHHLGAYEDGQRTKAFQLLKKLSDNKAVRSLLFFTGTPHKGSNFAFLSLMELLRPDLFNPDQPAALQFERLQEAMIRNNKICATDLKGNRLFKGHQVSTIEFEFSTAEGAFYQRLTEFIEEGFLYAGKLKNTEQHAVGLVLKAMQKLASSSVAAIRKALVKRFNKVKTNTIELDRKKELLAQIGSVEDIDLDRQARLEEEIAELDAEISVIEDERPFLQQLIALADEVKSESKIKEILDVLEEKLAGRNILFFTEYKATQALLLSALNKRFGDQSTGFINGDDRLDGVRMQDGRARTIFGTRSEQADLFNEGKIRFLVSTEAAGEGIDLQNKCHTLVHVDVPWNPMRMHQRVGRLNRYGQREQVEVFTLLNPGSVENHIRGLLQEKIQRINQALGAVMDEPEDMLQLVLGMEGPAFFDDLYAQGQRQKVDSIDQWFNSKTATFGSANVVNVVNALLGNVAKFDFQSVAKEIPEVDLGDLVPFFKSLLFLNGRELMTSGEDLEFVTPEGWLDEFGILDRYAKVRFNRDAPKDRAVFGVGARVVDRALDQAERMTGLIASLPADKWPRHLAFFRLYDRVSGTTTSNSSRLIGVEQDGDGYQLVVDGGLVRAINKGLATPKALVLADRTASRNTAANGKWLEGARAHALASSRGMTSSFQSPGVDFVGAVFMEPMPQAAGPGPCEPRTGFRVAS